MPSCTPAYVYFWVSLNCVSSAGDTRPFPSKPLRGSQSRLLTSTPSWSESDSAADKDIKGKMMPMLPSAPFLHFYQHGYVPKVSNTLFS